MFNYDAAVQLALVRQCKGEGGARNLRHLVQQQVESPLAQQLLEVPDCKSYHLTVEDDQILIKAKD